MPTVARPEPWQHRFVEANGPRFHVVTQAPGGGGASRGVFFFQLAEAPAKVNALLTTGDARY
jgi:hypothetical protein